MKQVKSFSCCMMGLSLLVLILTPACKKNGGNDLDKICDMMANGGVAMNGAINNAALSAGQTNDGSMTIPFTVHINQAGPDIVNAFPGHGWLMGDLHGTVNAKTGAISLQGLVGFNCILGAEMTDGTNLGGSINYGLTMTASGSGANCTFTITSVSFTYDKTDYNIFVTMRITVSASGQGSITMTGSINNEPINYSATF